MMSTERATAEDGHRHFRLEAVWIRSKDEESTLRLAFHFDWKDETRWRNAAKGVEIWLATRFGGAHYDEGRSTPGTVAWFQTHDAPVLSAERIAAALVGAEGGLWHVFNRALWATGPSGVPEHQRRAYSSARIQRFDRDRAEVALGAETFLMEAEEAWRLLDKMANALSGAAYAGWDACEQRWQHLLTDVEHRWSEIAPQLDGALLEKAALLYGVDVRRFNYLFDRPRRGEIEAVGRVVVVQRYKTPTGGLVDEVEESWTMAESPSYGTFEDLARRVKIPVALLIRSALRANAPVT